MRVELKRGVLPGDVFILDAKEAIFQWFGSKSNKRERIKGLDVALKIKDTERGGKVRIRVYDEGDEEDDFWEAIGDKHEIAGEAEEEDTAFENRVLGEVCGCGKAMLLMIGADQLVSR